MLTSITVYMSVRAASRIGMERIVHSFRCLSTALMESRDRVDHINTRDCKYLTKKSDELTWGTKELVEIRRKAWQGIQSEKEFVTASMILSKLMNKLENSAVCAKSPLIYEFCNHIKPYVIAKVHSNRLMHDNVAELTFALESILNNDSDDYAAVKCTHDVFYAMSAFK